MANKQALRDLQSRLAGRLQAARTTVRGQSWLAIETGGQGLVLPLAEAGEIFALAPVEHVPYSHRWFLGVANLRGHLHGVVDLAAFLGLKPPEAPLRDAQPRLIGFNRSLDINCVLQVERLSGLRSDEELVPEPSDGVVRPAFAGARLRDASGRLWQELRLSALVEDEAFLTIVG